MKNQPPKAVAISIEHSIELTKFLGKQPYDKVVDLIEPLKNPQIVELKEKVPEENPRN